MRPKPIRKTQVKKPVLAFVLNCALEGLGFLYLKRWKWAALNLGIALLLGIGIGLFIDDMDELLTGNYIIPAVLVYKVINGLIAYLATRYVNAQPIATKNKRSKKPQSFISSIKHLNTKEKIEVSLLLFTALAASLGAFAALKGYFSQNQKPIMALCIYKIEGKDEIALIGDEETTSFTETYSDEEFTEYALPMKLVNSGTVAADYILTWLDAEGGELVLPEGWKKRAYADHDRWFIETPNLYSGAEIPLPGVKVRIRNDSPIVNIKWSILAKNASPQNGSMTLHL